MFYCLFYGYFWIVVSVLKIVSFTGLLPLVRSIRASHITSSYMQSNSDFLFAKIEQSTVLINNANCQVHNAPCNDRKINDLCRRFRYLISWWHVRRKFMYRVYALVVAICTGGHVALDANYVYVDNIYRYVRFVPLSWFQYTFR